MHSSIFTTCNASVTIITSIYDMYWLRHYKVSFHYQCHLLHLLKVVKGLDVARSQWPAVMKSNSFEKPVVLMKSKSNHKINRTLRCSDFNAIYYKKRFHFRIGWCTNFLLNLEHHFFTCLLSWQFVKVIYHFLCIYTVVKNIWIFVLKFLKCHLCLIFWAKIKKKI